MLMHQSCTNIVKSLTGSRRIKIFYILKDATWSTAVTYTNFSLAEWKKLILLIFDKKIIFDNRIHIVFSFRFYRNITILI